MGQLFGKLLMGLPFPQHQTTLVNLAEVFPTLQAIHFYTLESKFHSHEIY